MESDSLSSAVDPKAMRKSVTKGKDDKKKQLIKTLSFKVLTYCR